MTEFNIIKKFKRIKFIEELLSGDSLEKFKRYLIIGFSTFFLEYGIFYALHNAAGLYYIYANTAAYFISFWFNFLLNRYWSFKSTGSIKRQLLQYLVLFSFNLVATNALMYVLSDLIGIIPELSKVLIMGAVVSWNFILYKKVIYK